MGILDGNRKGMNRNYSGPIGGMRAQTSAPKIQLLVYPNSEFQAQCGCRWMSPKSVLQQTVYGYAEDHFEETGHPFATGGTPIENGMGD